ncbi:hypothetical protein BCON_0108g00010 [Botryotinia convoluta]|uniref:Uncharacterized protein n=1 Tax=Botryotinia convoluta TaxID=54673 RepID=A0A4Z1ICF2_9HELO|nr:hypothetical protein BCON_0108g00010 [Botryotinia convoluta]
MPSSLLAFFISLAPPIQMILQRAAKGNKPRCFDDKGTWDLAVGGDGQVPAVVTWGGVKYNVNKQGNSNYNLQYAVQMYNLIRDILKV